MKCLLNKNLWENTGCTLNPVNPSGSDEVTADSFILLGKDRPSFLSIFC